LSPIADSGKLMRPGGWNNLDGSAGR
jgi:hypothetical protein